MVTTGSGNYSWAKYHVTVRGKNRQCVFHAELGTEARLAKLSAHRWSSLAGYMDPAFYRADG